MGRLLDEDLVIDVVRKWFDKINLNGDICIDGILALPSAQPEWKKGKWIKKYLKRKKAKNILLIHHGGIVQRVGENMNLR